MSNAPPTLRPAPARPRRAAPAALLVLLAALAGCGFLRPAGVRFVTPDEVAALASAPDGPLLVDARSREEYAEGHVPGAINVPFREIPSHVAELEAGRTRGVVTYCEHGPRSMLAQRALAKAGFTNLAQLEGDMSGWRASGRPIERGAATAPGVR